MEKKSQRVAGTGVKEGLKERRMHIRQHSSVKRWRPSKPSSSVQVEVCSSHDSSSICYSLRLLVLQRCGMCTLTGKTCNQILKHKRRMRVNSCQHCCNNFARSTCFSHREREQATTPRYAASVRTSSPKLFRIGVRGKSRFAAVPTAAASATASASSSCRVVRWHARARRCNAFVL
jgi:hypothetical protein